jgi:nitrate reductase gamma subunit
MSAREVGLWIILPYAATVAFVVGHWWRYRTDQFGWTSGSTQLLERKILGWASPAFHYGALAAIGGHVIGLMIPVSLTDALGVPENAYRWFSAGAGAIAGAVCVVGLAGLLYRRATNHRVRRTTSRTDVLTYVLLTVLIVMGTYMTFGDNLLASEPSEYRESIAPWWRSLFYLDPNVVAAEHAPFIYQAHAVIAWGFWALFPFSRLVHAWSLPVQYLGRPWILYRRRYAPARGR